MDLFESNAQEVMHLSSPLADRMRPDSLNELIGQEHITARGSLLQKAIEKNIKLCLGSDAHHPDDVGRYFDRIPELLSLEKDCH